MLHYIYIHGGGLESRWDDDGSHRGVFPEFRVSHEQGSRIYIIYTHVHKRVHCMYFIASIRVLTYYTYRYIYTSMCIPRATEVKNRTIYALSVVVPF